MDTLILEDFRCFAGRHEVPIRPLTLLVGENSTGKTSFLAAVRAAQDLLDGRIPDFNEDPIRLGSYDQIANYRGGRAGKAKSFTVGLVSTLPQAARRHRTAKTAQMKREARFRSLKDQPSLESFSTELEDDKITLTLAEGRWEVEVRENDTQVNSYSGEGVPRDVPIDDYRNFIFRAMREYERENSDIENENSQAGLNLIFRQLWPPPRMRSHAYTFAPIRTNPRRTYEPTAEVRDPEGSHIPMMLERLLGHGNETTFRERLEKFGPGSGLYSKLEIRRLGTKGSDPFQIEVRPTVRGRLRNLTDVGYGVSQAIPIIADCMSAEPHSTLLIQQPEVHLHPRAQAAMGTFFVELAASQRNRLVVETHSDNLLDRVRMEVSDEKISCDDVVILYFDQCRQGVQIHPIRLDKIGNLLDVPAGYRDFFLEEQNRFFGID